MPYPSSIVGRSVAPLSREITQRRVLAYAAGLGAIEPRYLDDAQRDGLVALPFQCVSCEWPVTVASRALVEGALTADEMRRAVHAAQDSVFHRPVRAGMLLRTEGRVISARASRAGVVSVMRLDTVDERDGAPVVTSWSTSIHRGVALEGDDRSVEDAPAPPGAAHAIDGDFATDILPVSRAAAHIYTECAEIWNPIHTEREVAHAAGLPDIILHGTATWALAGLTILRRYAANDATRLAHLRGRFSGMTIPGADIVIRSTASDTQGAVRFEVVTPDGAPILSDGWAVLT